ncbi:Uncharacterised protein [Vibrio vulnificus]|nr:hypothetical protein AL547_021185 [Vibrio vulnificus]SUP37737.1 Uncharacterised protein [Vibrio vulnificus]
MIFYSKEDNLDKDRAHALSWVVEDAVIDLIACSNFYRECRRNGHDPFSNKYHLGLVRMCYTTAIVTLSKLDEAINGFGKEINQCPPEITQKIRTVKQKIESLGVYNLRSKYIAHVFDGKGKDKMPMDIFSAYEALTKSVGKDIEEISNFYEWLFASKKTDCDVVSVLTELNEYLSTHVSRTTRY